MTPPTTSRTPVAASRSTSTASTPGDLVNATVTFAVHNPTRDDDVLAVDDDIVFIGEDANDGGGSEAGLDASQGYNLYQALTDGGYEPGRMGYHIKLTVHADGSIGADTKHKVFWVTDCVPPVGDDDDEIIDDEIVVIEEDDDIDVVDEHARGQPGRHRADRHHRRPRGRRLRCGATPSPANDVLVLGETLARPDVVGGAR